MSLTVKTFFRNAEISKTIFCESQKQGTFFTVWQDFHMAELAFINHVNYQTENYWFGGNMNCLFFEGGRTRQ